MCLNPVITSNNIQFQIDIFIYSTLIYLQHYQQNITAQMDITFAEQMKMVEHMMKDK